VREFVEAAKKATNLNYGSAELGGAP